MNDNDFCQMFFYSLINLICFLLNVIYLTTLFNVRSQYKLLGIEKIIDDDYSYYYDDDDDEGSDLEMYKNSYTATATLFAFNFLGFLGFMIVLLLLINKIKVNRTDAEMNNIPVQLHPNSDDIRTDERMGNSESITNTNNNGQKDEANEKLIKIMWIFFLFSQFVFLIEVIVITAYHSKSSDLESEYSELGYTESELNYFTKIYRDLIIVGYIFIVLFIIFDLIIAILTFQCGRRVKFMSNDMENLNEHKFCDCFSDCIINCCEKMAEIFGGCERENYAKKEILVKRLENLVKKYEELNTYSENLRKLNEDISGGKTIDSINTELEKLNLPKSEIVMITQRIEISAKK